MSLIVTGTCPGSIPQQFQHNQLRYKFTELSSRAPSSDDMVAAQTPIYSDTGELNDIRIEKERLINGARQLLLQNQPNHQKYRLYTKLKKLHEQRAIYLRWKAKRDFLVKYKEWEINDGQDKNQPELSLAKAEREIIEALNIQRILVRDFPAVSSAPQELLDLIKNLTRVNNDSAPLYYKKIQKKYSTAAETIESNFWMGEYYLGRKQYQKAEQHYKKVMKHKNHKMYASAVYKIGWNWLLADQQNRKSKKKSNNPIKIDKNKKKAITALKLVIRLTEGAKEKTLFNIHKEALSDIAYVWSLDQNDQVAQDFFQKYKYNSAWLEYLKHKATRFVRSQNYQEAIPILRRLILLDPLREDMAEIFNLYLDAIYRSQSPATLVANIKQLTPYKKKDHQWNQHWEETPILTKEMKNKIDFFVSGYGTLLHQEGEQEKNQDKLMAAANLYKIYTAKWPKSDKSSTYHYYLGTIHYQFEHLENAARRFQLAARKTKDNKLQLDSLWNQILCLSQLDENMQYPELPPLGKVPRPLAIHPLKQEWIEAVSLFTKKSPKQAESYQLRYGVGYTLLTYGHYAKAIAYLEKLGLEVPHNDFGRSSIETIISYLYEAEEWDTLISKSKFWLTQPQLIKAGLKKLLLESLQNGKHNKSLALKRLSEEEKSTIKVKAE